MSALRGRRSGLTPPPRGYYQVPPSSHPTSRRRASVGGTARMAKFHVVGDNFLPHLDRQVTAEAVRLEMIFLAHDEAQECLQLLGLLHAQPALALVVPDA